MALTVAMVVPPTLNLNTPYAAAPRLAGWLRHLGHTVVAIDMSLELFLRVFSRAGLERMFAAIDPERIPPAYEPVYLNSDRYIQIINDTVAVAQGRDLSAIARIADGRLIPEGPSFAGAVAETGRVSAGTWGQSDLARHLVSLMFLDLMGLFRHTIDAHFGVSNYAAKVASGSASFDAIAQELACAPNVYQTMLAEVADEQFPNELDLACFTCPFPGNLMGALLLGKWMSDHRPCARRALGGGYPSTELRQLTDPRVFDYIDYVVLDDGELPLQQICADIRGEDVALHSTFTRQSGDVVFHQPTQPAIPFRQLPAPSYDGFSMDRYIHLIYAPTPIQRLNSEGAWLKLTAAHGCYWKKCTFCDIHLSYIGDYDPIPARVLADQMDELHAQTGLSGFHFTDEAAPPSLLVNLALELIRRKRCYHWWGNIRYDSAFEPDRCKLLAASGMITVTGGIETASDAVLGKMAKGVTVEQLIKVLQGFSEAGVRTHGYLMYGFPGETVQDTINGLEVVRQLMRAGLLQGGFFHQLAVSAHAPLGRTPELFRIRVADRPQTGFARNYIPFEYRDGVPRSRAMFDSLTTAMNHYEQARYLDRDVLTWFRGQFVPRPTVSPGFVERVQTKPHPSAGQRRRLCWLGGPPRWSNGVLTLRRLDGRMYTNAAPKWMADNLSRCHPDGWHDARPPTTDAFASNEWIEPFRPHGLVLV